MTTRIIRVGNTLTVEIPEELVVEASLPVGEPLQWIRNGDGSIALVSTESREHLHIREGLAEFKAGKSASHERVAEWLDSWGTGNELPAPKVKILWSPTAISDLQSIRDYIAAYNPVAARKVAETRDLVIPGTSFIAAYTIQGMKFGLQPYSTESSLGRRSFRNGTGKAW
jgi:antitoxin component of MazEF toxin-antitoxin module